MVDKTAVALTEIKVVIPNHTSSHCILHCYILTGKKKEFHLRYVLDKIVIMINFIKSEL